MYHQYFRVASFSTVLGLSTPIWANTAALARIEVTVWVRDTLMLCAMVHRCCGRWLWRASRIAMRGKHVVSGQGLAGACCTRTFVRLRTYTYPVHQQQQQRQQQHCQALALKLCCRELALARGSTGSYGVALT